MYDIIVKKGQSWLIKLKKEPVDEPNARLFSQLIDSINEALKTIAPSVLVYYSTIGNYTSAGLISSYTDLNDEETIISSIVHKDSEIAWK